MQEASYSGFSTGVTGGSPSPSPGYSAASSHVGNESQPFLTPPSLYPPASKSVLSYMGAASHMPGSSLLAGGQPPSPSWQSSPPTTANQVKAAPSPSIDRSHEVNHNIVRTHSLLLTPTRPTPGCRGLVTPWAAPGTATTSPA